MRRILVVFSFLIFFFIVFYQISFACIKTGSGMCKPGSSDSSDPSLWCCDNSSMCTLQSRGILGTCVDTGHNLPPHEGYGNNGCHTTSICFKGNWPSRIVPGEQCGYLTQWHYGTGGGLSGHDVPGCQGTAGVCCDAGPASVTLAPPNPCPSQKGACTSIDTALGSIDVTNPGAFIAKVFGVLLSLSGGVAMILIILSGYRIMTAQGDPEKVKGAREMLTSAIIGLLFLIFSVTILQILGVDILHIPGFNK